MTDPRRDRRHARAPIVPLAAGWVVLAAALSAPARPEARPDSVTEARPDSVTEARPDWGPQAGPQPTGQPGAADPAAAVVDAIERRREARELQALAAEAYAAGRYEEAVGLFTRQIGLEPGAFTAHYNLACALGRLGRIAEGEASLQRAVEYGFSSLSTLRSDPDLEPLRGGELYPALIEHWPRVVRARRGVAVEAATRWMSRKPVRVELERHAVDVLSSYPERINASAVEQIEAVAGWFSGALAPGVYDEGAAATDAWVIVMLPEHRDFVRWLAQSFGAPVAAAGGEGIGGAYEHDDKRLVSRDLGASLRHEFFHVLHWRHMERLGQRHPIWIQEGLASLVEDMDPPAGGGSVWTPAPSWRTNIVRRLAGINRLTPWAELAGLDQRVFSSSRPLARYAEARALFLFLMERGLLGRWYLIYTSDPAYGHAADPSGLRAIARAAGRPLDELEAEYRVWAAEGLERVPEEFDELTVSMGLTFDTDNAATHPDGARITALEPGVNRATGLKLGDVILSIEGRPTNEVRDVVRALADQPPGRGVEVSYRRGAIFDRTRVVLRERAGGRGEPRPVSGQRP